jgi:electron transfer flavoprotein beta subunit
MKARSKPLAKMTTQELGVDTAARIAFQKAEEPKKRKGGAKVGSVEELVNKLKNEAKVI